MNKGNNIPLGYIDPANEERLYEPDLKEWRELVGGFLLINNYFWLSEEIFSDTASLRTKKAVWIFIKSRENDFIDYIESQAGECNKEMILAWVECDYNENT